MLAWAPVQELLRRIANRSTGPSEEELHTGRSRFWGEVLNAAGERRTARLETANGYRLTVDGMIMAVKFLLEHAPVGGYYTPSMLMGARCVEQCNHYNVSHGTTWGNRSCISAESLETMAAALAQKTSSGSIPFKKSAACRRLATIESRSLTS